jgi:hypothetical protein
MFETISRPKQSKVLLSNAFRSFVYGEQPYSSDYASFGITQQQLPTCISKYLENGDLLQNEHCSHIIESAIHYVISGFENEESWQQQMRAEQSTAIKTFIGQYGACKNLDYFNDDTVAISALFAIGCDYAHLIIGDVVPSINHDGNLCGQDEITTRYRQIRAAWRHDAIISLLQCTRRNNIDKVIAYLHDQYFFDSKNDSRGNDDNRSHHYWYGGLAQHSYGVYRNALAIAKERHANVRVESLIIAGLLHDICKAHHILSGDKIVKRPIHYYGHGKRSIFLLGDKPCGLSLHEDERIAIRCHMWKFLPQQYAGSANETLWEIIHKADGRDAKHNPSNYFSNKRY